MNILEKLSRRNSERGIRVTIERLNKYLEVCAEIDDIEQELNDNHYAADTVSTCTPPSYTQHSKRIDGFLPDGNTVSLLSRLSILKAEQRACEEYIAGIKDYQTRKMFRLKFIKGKTYLQVAMEVSNGRLTEDAVEKRIKRFLQKNQ